MAREVVVASGKGGSGKTFISSNMLYYLKINGIECVGVDADVEAPDLALSLGGYRGITWERGYSIPARPVIDYDRCTGCGLCARLCRAGAIRIVNGRPSVDPEACEGCGVCAAACPANAITLEDAVIGRLLAGETIHGPPVVSGDLIPGGVAGGKLVYELKEAARRLYRAEVYVVDSAPGIGCPVISSIVGADLLVIVVEPTRQSMQGALRLRMIAESLKTRYVALINKYDLNPGLAEAIEREFNVVGRIPYDPVVYESYVQMTPLLKYRPSSRASEELVKTIKRVMDMV